MRHIPHQTLLNQIFSDALGCKAKARLTRAHKKLEKITAANRPVYTRKNGPNKWKPIKDRLTQVIGRKCWYTEAELIGAPLAVDHYRPVCDYWWLAYTAENYRLSCPWANSPEHNAEHGCAGGKGENFPLIPPSIRANGLEDLPQELPVILDPCNPADCTLLAFQADGRPVLNPAFANDATAAMRVRESKILINLDHPEFNSKREQLCRDIAEDVKKFDALPAGSVERESVRNRIEKRLSSKAPFSAAARFYIGFQRDREWVETLLCSSPA